MSNKLGILIMVLINKRVYIQERNQKLISHANCWISNIFLLQCIICRQHAVVLMTEMKLIILVNLFLFCGGVRLCLPLPLFPHPYMVLPVSQSLLVQSVSALCLDYVPGVSSYVSLYKSVLPHVTCGLLLMSCVSSWFGCPSPCSCILYCAFVIH